MSKASDLRRRLDAITVAMIGTFAARLAKLTDDQCQVYDQWRDQCERYYAANPGGTAYARLLAGDQPPPLRSDVRTALFGPTPIITADMTDADAAETYRRFALGD